MTCGRMSERTKPALSVNKCGLCHHHLASCARGEEILGHSAGLAVRVLANQFLEQLATFLRLALPRLDESQLVHRIRHLAGLRELTDDSIKGLGLQPGERLTLEALREHLGSRDFGKPVIRVALQGLGEQLQGILVLVSGVMRHADAGYELAIKTAKDYGLKLPMIK